MTHVAVVFTEHRESGPINVTELVAILERIKPEVIFLECPPHAFDRYFDKSDARLEAAAVIRYLESHSASLHPVDLPTPDADFFANYADLLERVARTGPDYDRLASWHRQYVQAYGFHYLNSVHCSDLFMKRHQVMLAAIATLADHDLANCYDKWTQTNKDRDIAMMTNIESHCRAVPCNRAAFLVGAAHRQSIVELSVSAQQAEPWTVSWDFGEFLARPAETDPGGSAA